MANVFNKNVKVVCQPLIIKNRALISEKYNSGISYLLNDIFELLLDAVFYEKQKRRRERSKKNKTYKLDEVLLHAQVLAV